MKRGPSLAFASLRTVAHRVLAGALAGVVLGAPATASANDFQTVYNAYKKQGTIKPCAFSEQQLRNANHETPPDVAQYAPSFLDAVASAREQSGNCRRQHAQRVAAPAPVPVPVPTASTPAGAPPTPSTPTPSPTATTAQPAVTATTPAPTPPAQAPGAPALVAQHAAADHGAPAAVWLLALLGAAVVLAALGAALAWWLGWSPRPGLHASGQDFTDWLRLGS